MAFLHRETEARSGFGGGFGEKLSAFWAGLRAGFEAFQERHSRLAEVRRLDAMSDDELAKLGVSRDRIVHYVFRDKLFV
jgi:uncharacterized protein YjiS (DUF1127 family)